MKQAVWERDQGRCTFMGENGKLCGSRDLVEFDHVDPVARGGQATVEGVRLRCRGHNQLEAERVFGAGFMNEKREARRAATKARRRAAANEDARAEAARARATAEAVARVEAEAAIRARAEAEARARAAAEENVRDLNTCLRELGFRAAESRRAIEYCATLPDATLEQRVRAALGFLCPKPRSMAPATPAPN